MDKNKVVKSPVTGSNNVALVDPIPVQKIIERYKGLEDIDVSEFFKGIEEVAIYKCTDTDFRFYYPESIFADEKFYAFLQQRDNYYSEWHWEHNVALKKSFSSK
jgi:hypothetical protein